MVTILFNIANEVLWLYQWAVILAALFNMLAQFGVLDTRNKFVWSIGDFLYRITEPALRRIRRVVPSFGSIDVSPLVLIFGIYVLQQILQRIYRAISFGDISGLLL
ncbi:MAG: YggT family protein [Acetobacteraceae bacterium]|nr:YggT family protein [Acetobacteraceae bacterium]